MAQAFGNMVPALASITLLSSHLIFGHWALSSPNSSLMSLVLMLASKHKVQRGHTHSFHLNHKFIQIRWLIHTQSLTSCISLLLQNYLEDQEFGMLL